MNARRTLRYCANSLRACFRYRTVAPVTDAVWYYKQWKASVEPGATPLTDGLPWITLRTTAFLKHFMRPGFSVFEYGTGGSTIFFARHAAHVISVEHDPQWLARVQAETARLNLSNWEGKCVLPAPPAQTQPLDPADPEQYASGAEAFKGCTFRDYVATIDLYPDHAFDIILIDGRARPSCFKHAIRKVKEGGLIVLDNSERDYYWPATACAASGFRLVNYPGRLPYSEEVTQTSVWHQLPRSL